MILSFRAFFSYPLGNLGVDQSKLSLESPFTQIAWHLMPWTIRFDSSVHYYSDGTMYPSLLSHQTSIVAAALLIYKNVVKSCVFSCYCVVVCCDFCCFVWCNFYCFVFAFSVVVVVIFAALVVGFWPMTYVIFAALIVGFGALLLRREIKALLLFKESVFFTSPSFLLR